MAAPIGATPHVSKTATITYTGAASAGTPVSPAVFIDFLEIEDRMVENGYVRVQMPGRDHRIKGVTIVNTVTTV